MKILLFILVSVASSLVISCELIDENVVVIKQKAYIQDNQILETQNPCNRSFHVNEILELPDEVVFNIFLHCSIYSLLQLEQTHSIFHNFIRGEPRLWRTIINNIHGLQLPRFAKEDVNGYINYLKELLCFNLEVNNFYFVGQQRIGVDNDGNITIHQNCNRNDKVFVWKYNASKIIQLDQITNASHKNSVKSYSCKDCHSRQHVDYKTLEINNGKFMIRYHPKIRFEIHNSTGSCSARTRKIGNNYCLILLKKPGEDDYKVIKKGVKDECFKLIKMNEDGSLLIGLKSTITPGQPTSKIPFYIKDGIYKEINAINNTANISSYIPLELNRNNTLIKFLVTDHNGQHCYFYNILKENWIFTCDEQIKAEDIIIGHNDNYYLRLEYKSISDESQIKFNFKNTVVIYRQDKTQVLLSKFNTLNQSINSNDSFIKLRNTQVISMHKSPSHQWLILLGRYATNDLIFRINLAGRRNLFQNKSQ